MYLLKNFQISNRDIKPENILIDKDSNAYLADFDTLKFDNFSFSASTYSVAGSP